MLSAASAGANNPQVRIVSLFLFCSPATSSLMWCRGRYHWMRWKGGGRLGGRVSGGNTGRGREAARGLSNTDAEASAASIMAIEEEEASSSCIMAIEEEEASSSSGQKHDATSAEHDSSASSNRRDSDESKKSRGSSSSPWGRFGALTTIKKCRQHASTESSRAREQVTPHP